MTKRRVRILAFAALVLSPVLPTAWNNGPAGNASTNVASECTNPPYATHDWIADHAVDLLPDAEKAWLLPHKTLYLLGTEAPDNNDIPASCGAPNTGYDDRGINGRGSSSRGMELRRWRWIVAHGSEPIDRPGHREHRRVGRQSGV